MKGKIPCLLLFMNMLLFLSACNLPLGGAATFTPTLPPPPTASPSVIVVSPTAQPSPTSTLPSASPTATLPQPTAVPPSATPPFVSSNLYAVILVKPDDVLNIRSGVGVNNPIVGSFAATATNVQRTGPTATSNDEPWVEVQNPAGGTGWSNAVYLTEYVSSADFCSDARVTALLDSFKQALNNADGDLLASLVSPAHGLVLYFRRYGHPVFYTPDEASWLFQSTFEVNWGAGPSGVDDIGTFREVPLPKLLDVLNAGTYEQRCNDPSTASMYVEPWPKTYTNINFYALYKPGTPNVDLDWRTWLAGIEYIEGKPYLFALIHFEWEP